MKTLINDAFKAAILENAPVIIAFHDPHQDIVGNAVNFIQQAWCPFFWNLKKTSEKESASCAQSRIPGPVFPRKNRGLFLIASARMIHQFEVHTSLVDDPETMAELVFKALTQRRTFGPNARRKVEEHFSCDRMSHGVWQ